MYKIAYNARLRRNEIVYLAWDDVDFKNETITVCNSDGHSTKSRKIRPLPMVLTITRPTVPKKKAQ